MTLAVITGKPGHGKTLYAVAKIQERAKAENRQVYYNGIEGLKLDWIKIEDAQKWHDPEHVPDGGIIVIDEAQRVFPPRPTGSKVPPFVQPFDVHRHRGLDIYLITQDPMLIDSFARNLAGEHIHVLRPFGSQQAKVYKWEHVVDPDSRSERANAVDTGFFRYPKQVFDLYHSATVHTVKRKLPWKLALGIPGLVLGLVVCVLLARAALGGKSSPSAPVAEKGSTHTASSGKIKNAPLTPEEYVDRLKPRVAGRPESAPIFDDLALKPAVMPVVAGCVTSAQGVCKCYTQQATPVKDVPDSECREFVKEGRFIAYDSKALGVAQVDRNAVRLKDLQAETAKLRRELSELKQAERNTDADKGRRQSVAKLEPGHAGVIGEY